MNTMLSGNIKMAREQVDGAMKVLRNVAKEAINNACLDLLSEPDVQYVSWGQKSSEYNDEGMYPGVHGPVVNDPVVDTEDDRWDKDWVYGYGNTPTDARVTNLKEILNDLGDEVLSELFGDENAVDAKIVDGKVTYITDYVGV